MLKKRGCSKKNADKFAKIQDFPYLCKCLGTAESPLGRVEAKKRHIYIKALLNVLYLTM